MQIFSRACVATLWVAVCACEIVEEDHERVEASTVEQEGMNLQGMNLQGMNLQGMNLQGMNLQGFQLGNATLSGVALQNLRVERGELVAERNGKTLRGRALEGALLRAVVRDEQANPPATVLVTYRIDKVRPELSQHDPTNTGSTYLYTLEQWVSESNAWKPACAPDADGRRVAIPLTAIWGKRGERIESSSLFTLACTTGVIAKCYRWGYKPWVTGYGDLAAMHWTCTRLARADYCGNGVPHTQDGTWINIWDTLPAPGPIQHHGDPPPTMVFEAGWNTGGAVCLGHTRWLRNGAAIAAMCPHRLIRPGIGPLVCNSLAEALQIEPSTKMFNESYLQP
jgi:hypothetical protein